MKALFALLLLTALPSWAVTRSMNYCNYSTETIFMAAKHSWLTPPDDVFGSSSVIYKLLGWYKIDVGQCRSLTFELRGWDNSDGMTLYAKGSRGSIWDGNDDQCIKDGSAFEFSTIDQCLNSGGRRVKGIRIGMGDFNFNGGNPNSFLKVCNNRKDGKTIDVSYAAWRDKNWTSQGWWPIDPNQCREIELGRYEGSIYMTALMHGGIYYVGQPSAHFCINAHKGFTIPFADSEPCNAQGHKRQEMFKRHIQKGSNHQGFE